MTNRALPIVRAVVTLAAVVSLTATDSSAQPKRGQIEWVVIDGRKNPEQIPEWSAWESVFSDIAGGRKLLPSNVQSVVSQEEADLIRRESEASVRRSAEYKDTLLNLTKTMPGSTPLKRLGRQKEIRLECRWANLHARDRLLAALNPAAAAALTAYAQEVKKGTTFTVAKSEVAFLRLPQ
jgi:hypothetical protein